LSEKGLDKVFGIMLDPVVETKLGVLPKQIHGLNKGISKLDTSIMNDPRELDAYRNLKSNKGIGDIKGFGDESKLAACFGIAFRTNSSSEIECSRVITKRGNKLERTTLVQCALTAIGCTPYLADLCRRVKARRSTGKATVALAKEFLRIVYQTFRCDWVFDDFPSFVLAQQVM
jgi:hypothetical protein